MLHRAFAIKGLAQWSPAPTASLVAFWLIAVGNYSFWVTLAGSLGTSSRGIAATIAMALVLWASLSFAVHLLTYTRLHRWLWALLLLTSASAAHFVDYWGVLIDKAMLSNVLQTDISEALDLLTLEFALDILLRGVLPAALVLLWPMRRASLREALVASAAFVLIAVGLLVAAGTTYYSEYAPTFRNHRELRYQLVPANYLRAGWSLATPASRPPSQPIHSIAADASRVGSQVPLLFVLVIGETARADNFSLGGYPRPTNEALSNWALRYFKGVKSCGTDTATSLPCMFTDIKGDGYSVEKASERENVLDILRRTGVSVNWYENNSGCKRVCDRVPTTRLQDLHACAGRECTDADFAAVVESLEQPQADTLLVIHQQGSHGPAYFKRYTGEPMYEPACETNRLQDCPRETVVNAYDSSIHFTSAALARLLESLQRRSASDMRGGVALLYVSDHGESLGERGIYLHGLPGWMAPHEQFHVPMILWMDHAAQERLAPAPACLDRSLSSDMSHDYIFHTLLGVFGVRTSVYQPQLDIFSDSKLPVDCRPKSSDFLRKHLVP